MTSTKTSTLAPGDKFHVLLEGLTLGAQTCARGITYEATAEWISDTTDRNGACIFDLIDDQPVQRERFGSVVFARGEWPEAESLYLDDQRKVQLAREIELEIAMGIEDEEARRRRRHMVNTTFPAQSTFFLTTNGVTERQDVA